MAQYIKKVGVTPTRGNGFIINSFNTNDNHEFNAPSMEAVESRTDNNILFMGKLGAITKASVGGKICGWSISPSSKGSFAPVNGLMIFQDSITVTAPLVASYPNDIEKKLGFSNDTLFSFSFYFASIGSQIGQEIPLTLGKIEAFNYNNRAEKVFNYNNIFEISIFTVTEGGYFRFTITILNSDYSLCFPCFKLEVGATCTPISAFSRDTGIQGAIDNTIENAFMLKRYRKQNISVPTIGASGDFDVVQDGYTAIAIAGFDASAFTVFRECRLRFNGEKVDFFLNNTSSSSATATIIVDVLYIKNEYATNITRSPVIDV